jgi:hypothetical protein
MKQDPSHSSGGAQPSSAASAHNPNQQSSYRKPFHHQSGRGYQSNKHKPYNQHSSHSHNPATKSYSSTLASSTSSASSVNQNSSYNYRHPHSQSQNSNARSSQYYKRPNVSQLRIGDWVSVKLVSGATVKGQLYCIDFEKEVVVLLVSAPLAPISFAVTLKW